MSALDQFARREAWVSWRIELRKGKPTKVPFAIDGREAKANDPSTWMTRAQALRCAREREHQGIGIMLGPLGKDRHLGGIDLDSCLDADGTVAPWAREILGLVPSYTEISPSRRGLKIYFEHDPNKTLKAAEHWRRGVRRKAADGGKDHGIELYLADRYFAVTGETFEVLDTVRLVGLDRLAAVQAKMDAFQPRPPPKPRPASAHPRRYDTDEERLLDAIDHIANPDLHWEEWNRIGLAIWAATSGGERGRAAFLAFSAKSTLDDAAYSNSRWDEIGRSKPTRIGAGTIFYEAEQAGWRNPRSKRNGHDQPPPKYDAEPVADEPPRSPKAQQRRALVERADKAHRQQWEEEQRRRQQQEAQDGDVLPPLGAPLGNPFFPDGYVLDAFIQLHAQDWRYVKDWNRWLHWDGRRWRGERTNNIRDLFTKLCAVSALALMNKISGKQISTIESLAQAQRLVARISDDFDQDPWLLNTATGTIDLRTQQVRLHRRGDHFTRITRAAAGSAAQWPRWLEFLDMITGGDLELQVYLQRLIGYCLTGDISEQMLAFLYGEGANGKSTFINVVRLVLGDYARHVPAETFIASRQERHPTELASLLGRRLITATEIKHRGHWHETRVKELTGGEPVATRFMRQDFFEFEPQFKLLISGNSKPSLHAVDEAMRRRLHLIPFTVTIPPDRREKGFASRLFREEGDGILQWAIEGCVDWQREGLRPPAKVLAATEEYFAEQDTLQRWIQERCGVGKPYSAMAKALFGDWKSWCEGNGEHPGTSKSFGQTLDGKGFRRDRTMTGIRYFGLRLIVPFDPPSP